MADKKQTWWWWAIGGLVVLVVLLLLLRSAGVVGQSNALAVELDTVKTTTLVETVVASGKLQPATEVKISADVSGEIITLPVEEGDHVEQGDLLVRINPEIYQANLQRVEASLNNARASLAQMRANLTQMEARLEVAEQAFERTKQLHEQQAVSQAEYEQALSNFRVAKAQVEAAEENVSGARYSIQSAQAMMQEAQENLQRTSIYSPITGTISMLNVELGERVVGTTQMMGTELMRVAKLQQMEVEVDVVENEIIRVDEGDTAIIEVDAFPEEEFRGVVTEIASSARTEGVSLDRVTNFKVKIRVLPESYANLADTAIGSPFKPGMSAVAEIITSRKEGVLSVPILAVTTRPANELSAPPADAEEEEEIEVVFKWVNGVATAQPVVTGIQDDFTIQILEGLEKGDVIIGGPYSVIRILEDEQSVQVEDE